MSKKPKRAVVAQCPDGPCASKEEPGTTDVVVEIRELGMSPLNPIDPSQLTVTLTALDQSSQRQADSLSKGSGGQVIAKFAGVKNGWYRALGVRLDPLGKVESSAARNAQVTSAKLKIAGDAQRILLVLSKQGVAVFVFLDDIDAKPLQGTTVIIRHPDGSERQHVSDGGGEVRIPGGVGDVFTVVQLAEPRHGSIARVTQEESLNT